MYDVAVLTTSKVIDVTLVIDPYTVFIRLNLSLFPLFFPPLSCKCRPDFIEIKIER